MEHFCRVIMLGRATGDPVERHRGRATVVEFGFVYNDRFKVGREWVDNACFIDCEAGDELRESVGRLVRKGYLLMVEGRLRLDEWTDAQKVRHRRHKLILTSVKVMARPKAGPPAAPPAQNSESLFDRGPDGEPEVI